MSFHVPELARNMTHPQFGSTSADGNNGAFDVESSEPGWRLTLIASDGTEEPDKPDYQWEHVSVSARQGRRVRIPTWKEMCYVKRLCWDEEDVVVQYHPRRSCYVNCHPCVLHLWRPKHEKLPEPPAILVGPIAEEPPT